MKNYSSLFILLVLFAGCNKVQPTESYQDLFGTYKSSAFIEPGANDAGVNIQSAGGYFNITLQDNYKFLAEILIPDSINSNFAVGLWNYSGNYTLKGDTLEFESQSLIVNNLKWNKQNKQLESFEVPLRGNPFKIILFKY